MGIQMIGIDHSRADIDIRSLFSFTKKQMQETYEEVRQIPGLDGCVILSTCNRMELWVNTGEAFQENLYELLCRWKKVCPGDYLPYMNFMTEEDAAVRHLFRLAGGLESRILGEDQIVTQVNEALVFARENFAVDHVLETLFRQAVTAAKKVKTEVVLSNADESVVHVAIETLKEQGLSFSGKKCMVIGNGIMGKLAANLLQKQGAQVTVTVRQYRSGLVEIPEHCSRIDYGQRLELLPFCDYVFSATKSPNFTLTRDQLEGILTGPVILVDLAVPRDIDPLTRELKDVFLYDIDSFQRAALSENQKQAISQAEAYFQEQIDEFHTWYHCLDTIPRIQQIKEEAAEDLVLRLTKPLRQLPVDSPQKEEFTRDLRNASQKSFNKLLFGLRSGISENAFREVLSCLSELY